MSRFSCENVMCFWGSISSEKCVVVIFTSKIYHDQEFYVIGFLRATVHSETITNLANTAQSSMEVERFSSIYDFIFVILTELPAAITQTRGPYTCLKELQPGIPKRKVRGAAFLLRKVHKNDRDKRRKQLYPSYNPFPDASL